MGDGVIDIDTGAMRKHAGNVRGIVPSAQQAKDAADEVSFHPTIYGKIGEALVYPLLAPLELAGSAAAGHVTTSLGDTADAVDALADTFDFVDDTVNGAMKKIKGLF